MDESSKLLQLLMDEEEQEGATTDLVWMNEDQQLQLDDETCEGAADCEMADCTESYAEVTAATLSAIATMKHGNRVYGIPSTRRDQQQQVDSCGQPPRAPRGSYRQRQKQEIESLRGQVSTLEYELRFLQTSRDRFSTSESVESGLAPTIGFAPLMPEPLHSEDVDMSLDASSWKTVARREYQARELAERENQVLKQDLKRQLRLVNNVQSSLLQIRPDPVTQSYLPREEEADFDQRTPISTSDWSSLDEDSSSNLDTDLFTDLLDASDDELMPNMISLGVQLLFVPFRRRGGQTDERPESVPQPTSHHGLLYSKGYPSARSSDWRQQWHPRSDIERRERFVYAAEPRNSAEAAAHDQQRTRHRGWWGVFERLPSSFRSRTLFRACFYLEQQLLAATSGVAGGKAHCVDPYQVLRVGKLSDHALHSFVDSSLGRHCEGHTEPVASASVLRSVVATH